MEGIRELLTDIRWALKTFNSRLAPLVPSSDGGASSPMTLPDWQEWADQMQTDVVVLKQRAAALESRLPSDSTLGPPTTVQDTRDSHSDVPDHACYGTETFVRCGHPMSIDLPTPPSSQSAQLTMGSGRKTRPDTSLGVFCPNCGHWTGVRANMELTLEPTMLPPQTEAASS